MACDLIAGLKIIEVFLCVVCLIYKLWTMWETLRVFYELEKQSREWPLSRRIAVDRTGSIFSDIVLGSYVIITIGLLIGHVKGELTKARSTEGFYLVLGTILFLIVGGVSITSVDDVPHKLVDNGIILGILTIVTAITFLLDIALVRKQPGQTETKPQKPKQFTYQKETPKKLESKPNAEKVDEVDKNKKRGSGLFQELKSSLKRRTDGDTNHQNTRTPERTVEFQERELHESERQKRATDEISPQVGRRNMENRGFNKQYSHEDDAASRRSLDPEEFERSFHKIQKQPNGYIKNDDRQAAFNTRDDERSYLRNGDPNYRRHNDRENPFTRAEEYHSERYRENYRSQNGYVRRDGGEHVREEYHRPNGHIRHGDESDFQQKQRRHSIDFMDRDDSSRRSKEYHRERVTRAESPQRSYRTEGGDEYSRVIKNQDRNEFEDLRKPQYVEDRRSYKGYADTVKYLENTSAEKQQRVIDDVDSAMPPKHVIEVEMDDHFYRPGEPQTKKSERRGDERDTLQVAKVSSSQKAEHTGSSDDSELIPQIPSVSFLLSERGRKIMPSLSTSPVERASTPKYYFADPSSPGFVKQTASNWPTSSPVKPQDPKTP